MNAIRTLTTGMLVMLAATPCAATFHEMEIEAVLTGTNGSTDVQFVQLKMLNDGQDLVTGAKLITFEANGSFSEVVLTMDKNVANDDEGNRILMASASFEEATGLTPDFVFPDGSLPAQDGMVCWGKPFDQTNPNSPNMIDCVSYGDYTGSDNNHTSAPAESPFGHGIQRIQDTDDSAADFECQDPVTAITNEPDKIAVDATTPCGGSAAECGNGILEDPELCDDGDTDFTQGDFCSASCDDFGCGIPRSPTATEPLTSDALFVLRTAVGVVDCDLRVCDVNDSGEVNTSDALAVLRSAVGQPVELNCPPQGQG
jgi:cysteine-rich repeat protein